MTDDDPKWSDVEILGIIGVIIIWTFFAIMVISKVVLK
jgi:hypothetical protein